MIREKLMKFGQRMRTFCHIVHNPVETHCENNVPTIHVYQLIILHVESVITANVYDSNIYILNVP